MSTPRNPIAFMRPLLALWLCLAVPLLGGCQVHARYLVDCDALISLSAMPESERARAVVPASTDPGHKPALVRASSFPALPIALPAGNLDPVPIRTSVPSKMVTAGVILTITGSICSVVGTSVWLATRNTGRDSLSNGFGILELTGEPQMLAGTILWIYGLTRSPQEAAPGESGTLPLPASAISPSPAASLLRF